MSTAGAAGRPARGELQGKVALITGATGGIGTAIVQALARAGADIAAVHRSEDKSKRLQAEVEPLGVRYAGIQADLSNADEVHGVVARAVEALGRVDFLINNAALQAVKPYMEQTAQEWDQVMAVNLRAPFLLSQSAGAQMIAQGDGGRIINMSSSSAYRALGSPPAYTASKAAVGGLTRVSAAMFGRHKILVNAIAPGITSTPFTRSVHGQDLAEREPEGPLANLLGRVAVPDDIAAVIVFLCSDASRNITGQVIQASAGAIV